MGMTDDIVVCFWEREDAEAVAARLHGMIGEATLVPVLPPKHAFALLVRWMFPRRRRRCRVSCHREREMAEPSETKSFEGSHVKAG